MEPGTPLPYRASGNSIVLGVNEERPGYADVFSSHPYEDAVYIVHAANLYPELVEALTRIMHYAEMGASICDVDTSEQPEFTAARTVLAKAKGE